MAWRACAAVGFASLSTAGSACGAQSALHIVRATTGWTYAVASRPSHTIGALVLMPGYGGSFTDFSERGHPEAGRPAIADLLVPNGIALVLVAPPAGTLFGGASHIRQLEDTIVEALRTVTPSTLPIAIGGFSAGGTDAILLAERCGARACRMPHAVAAVFTVDAPLDWYRLWSNAVITLAEAPARANVTEARLIRNVLESRIGHRPAPTSRAYLAASPLASRERDGGNARALAHIAVRAYTEPDIAWWMANRGGDYYGLNALDAASLIRHLTLLGNAQAELIVTTDKGYRADGTRHPHSWSIVDQPALAQWITDRIGGQGSPR